MNLHMVREIGPEKEIIINESNKCDGKYSYTDGKSRNPFLGNPITCSVTKPLMKHHETHHGRSVKGRCNVCGEQCPRLLSTCSEQSPILATANLPWHKELRAQISRLSDDPEKRSKYFSKTLDQLVNNIL